MLTHNKFGEESDKFCWISLNNRFDKFLEVPAPEKDGCDLAGWDGATIYDGIEEGKYQVTSDDISNFGELEFEFSERMGRYVWTTGFKGGGLGSTNDRNFYAYWTCNIDFETNGGTAVTRQVVRENEKATEPATPEKGDSTFLGWYTDENYTTEYNFNDPVTRHTTLYAKWNTHTVTFDTDGGAPVPESQTVDHGETATLPTTQPEKGIDEFLGWYLADAEEKYNFSTRVTEDITLYARWNGKHTVTFDTDKGTPEPEPQTVAHEGTAEEPTPQPEKGTDEFLGWYLDDADEEYNFATQVTRDITLYARWRGIHTVTFDTDGGTPVPEPQTVAHEGIAEEPTPQPTRVDDEFLGWYPSKDSDTKYNFETPVIKDIILYAKWEGDEEEPSFAIDVDSEKITAEVKSIEGFSGTPDSSKIAFAADGKSDSELMDLIIQHTGAEVVEIDEYGNRTPINTADITVANFNNINWNILTKDSTEYPNGYPVTLTAHVNSEEITTEVYVELIDTTIPVVDLESEKYNEESERHEGTYSLNAINKMTAAELNEFIISEFLEAVTDNYYLYSDGGIQLELDYNGEDMTKEGTHMLRFIATDGSENIGYSQWFAVTLITDYPEIWGDTPITYWVGTAGKTGNIFLEDINAGARDGSGNSLTVQIDPAEFAKINFNVVGSYEVEIWARDSQDRRVSKKITVNIVTERTVNNDDDDDDDYDDDVIDTITPPTTIIPETIDTGESYSIAGRTIRAVNNPVGSEFYDIFDEDDTPLGSIAVPEGKTVEEVLLETDLTPTGTVTMDGKANPKTGSVSMGHSTVALIALGLLTALVVVVRRKLRTKSI